MSKPKRKTYQEMRQQYVDKVKSLAETAWAEYMRCPYQQLYLVGRKVKTKDGEIWAELLIGHEDSVMPCVVPQALPRDVTAQGMYDYLHAILNKEPLWIYYGI